MCYNLSVCALQDSSSCLRITNDLVNAAREIFCLMFAQVNLLSKLTKKLCRLRGIGKKSLLESKLWVVLLRST